MINKLTASLLFAHSYKLVDKEGNEYKIYKIQEDGDNVVSLRVTCEGKSKLMYLDQIGQDFFVLCRPLTDLTKEVNGVVPLIEIAQTFQRNIKWELTGNSVVHRGVSIKGSPGLDLYFEYSNYEKAFIAYYKRDTETDNFLNKKTVRNVNSQEKIFNKLYSLHFKPSSLPDECCRFITV